MEKLTGSALVIGAGRVGERFAKALRAQDVSTMLYDIVPQKALDLSRRLGALYTDRV